jgi:SAM-dependent methyltransferase
MPNAGGLKKPPLLASRFEEDQLISTQIAEHARSRGKIEILEAGCGQKWGLDLGLTEYVLTGVDLDEAALAIRMNQSRDLDIAIKGDLRSVDLPPAKFDVIFSSFVLEHVPEAEVVLENFLRWLKPDGLLIVRVPDLASVHGFLTRVTPHWFHVWYYRSIKGHPNAGQPGHVPYPVHYSHAISRKGIRDFASVHGLEITGEFADAYVRPGKGLTRSVIHFLKLMIQVSSLGRLTARHTNLLFMLRRRHRNSAQDWNLARA